MKDLEKKNIWKKTFEKKNIFEKRITWILDILMISGSKFAIFVFEATTSGQIFIFEKCVLYNF